MKYTVNEFKVPVTDGNDLISSVVRRYSLKENEIKELKILKKSIDARNKDMVMYSYYFMIDMKVPVENKYFKIYEEDDFKITYPKWNKKSPVIVGFGPSGMFAALYLARCGANPIIVERGSSVDLRVEKVMNFVKNKVIDTECNIQFGEGGAGTFSDGKLTTNLSSPYIKFIMNEFYLHGAKEDILYYSEPHIGTDYLVSIVKNIRKEIETLGGKFLFDTKFLGYENDNGLIALTNSDELPKIKTEHIIIGIGHSARDTIKTLYESGLNMEAKAFSMGVRIEHPQMLINESQYGRFAKYLPPATYRLVSHQNDRSVYSFCMCPGGEVIPSASEANSIVTNGMSTSRRDALNSNSAILAEVKVEDYFKSSVLDGMAYQEKYEKLAFNVAGDYRAPANLVKEFMMNRIARGPRSVRPSYKHGLIMTDFNKVLPKYVVDAIRRALPYFDRKIEGFMHPDAVMTGIESRSSSPVRIIRNDLRESNVKGIYPIGEGAGYAGGITSAALDGLKTAIFIAGE